MNSDLRTARGIMYAVPLALLAWGIIIMALIWVFEPMQERTIDDIASEWAGK